MEDRRADEVSFRMLESTSGLQIANFRRAGSISALSMDANAHLEGEGEKEGTFSTPFVRHFVVLEYEWRDRERTTKRTARAVEVRKNLTD